MATETADTRGQVLSPTVAMGLEETDAKMVVATSHGGCQKLKDLVQQQDPTTMLVVMASSKAAPKKSCCASMHPLLAAAACRGNLEELKFLLNNEQSDNLSQEFRNQAEAYNFINDDKKTSAMGAGSDVEQGGGIDDAAVPPLVNGVTVEGDTVLHLVAAHGDAQNFLGCADFIHGLEEGLLCMENYNGDTPLHCAARAGRTKMVSRLITLAQGDGIVVEQLLRKENKRKETALHEAVRIGDNDLVTELLRADGELACFPGQGTSPLYLAISLGRVKTAKTLHDESKNNVLSYSGPDGQNALHAAVLRGPVLTRMVLKWDTNKDLTTKRDINGSTPLHFAAGLAEGWGWPIGRPKAEFAQVLEANTGALYQPDNKGLYPIHVAASAGAKHAIELIVKKCGGTSAGLRDAEGRTFLHVAVGERKLEIVGYACRNRSLAWILNMQDNDGNTALHLAVEAGILRMFSALVANRHVELNLANAERETPLDIANYKIPRWFFNQNSEARIRHALWLIGAGAGTCSRDHFKEKYEQIHGRKTGHEKKDMETVKDTTQAISIGSVLIATVTFSANFALPGGYRADDHTNGGTPTLAGRYAFDGFVMANTLAFTLSSIAIVLLLYAGSPYINTRRRTCFSAIAFSLMDISLTYFVAAFAMAVYVVLGPVARKTAVAACVLSLSVVLCNHAMIFVNMAILARPLFVRFGALLSLLAGPFALVGLVLLNFWPFTIILLWAAYGRN